MEIRPIDITLNYIRVYSSRKNKLKLIKLQCTFQEVAINSFEMISLGQNYLFINSYLIFNILYYPPCD